METHILPNRYMTISAEWHISIISQDSHDVQSDWNESSGRLLACCRQDLRALLRAAALFDGLSLFIQMVGFLMRTCQCNTHLGVSIFTFQVTTGRERAFQKSSLPSPDAWPETLAPPPNSSKVTGSLHNPLNIGVFQVSRDAFRSISRMTDNPHCELNMGSVLNPNEMPTFYRCNPGMCE